MPTMTINVNSPTDANYSTGDGNEVHRDPPPGPPPPPEGPHSGGDGVDMSPVSHDESGSYSPPPSTPSPAPTPSSPFEVNVGVELDGTLISPQFPGQGGQAGLNAGVSSSTGPYLDSIQPAQGGPNGGAAVGVSLSGTVSFGYPTSEPAVVIGGAYPPYAGSVSYAPGENGGFGTVQISFGAGAEVGGYVTSTQTTNIAGRGPAQGDGPEPPENDMHAGVHEPTDGGAPDDGLEAPDPIAPSIHADSTEERKY
jgi:hypothetical protein